MMEMAYMHNIIDEDLMKDWWDNDCVAYFRDVYPAKFKEDCSYVIEAFFKNMEKINIYDVYRSNYIEIWGEDKGKVLLNGKEEEYERGFTLS